LSKRVCQNHTLLTIRQFKGRDSVEKTIKLKFVFDGDRVKRVTCSLFSIREGDESDDDRSTIQASEPTPQD
jgi:hypothetical protein